MFDSPLSSSPLSAGSGTGSESLSIDLAGDAVVVSSATGALYPTYLTAEAQSVATATGVLANALALAANTAAQASATGNLAVLTALGGAASAIASATAALIQSSHLSGEALTSASATASVTSGTAMAGSAAGASTASGSLSLLSNIAGAAAAIATAAGELDQGIAVAGAAQAVATAAGNLSNVIAMQGTATAQASATGALSKAETITGGLVYAVNLTTGAVTTLSNFYFERLVRAHGRTYGLLAGTLYRIEGTADPGDTPISVSIRTGSIPPKADVLRRLDKVYLHARERDGITMTPIYDEVQGRTHYPKPGIRNGMIVHRTNIGLNNQWHTLGLQITNIDGGALDVGGLEVLTAPLTRRIP